MHHKRPYFLLFYTLSCCGKKWSACPLAKRKKRNIKFSLQGDWKCCKLIQQKCSVGVSCFEVSLEFLWSRSPVLSGANEGHALFRCGCIYFLWVTHPEFCWQPGGQEEALCQTASCRVGSRILAFAEDEQLHRDVCPVFNRTGCSDSEILLNYYFPGVNLMNESGSVKFDHVLLCLPHRSLNANQSLMWSQGLMGSLFIEVQKIRFLCWCYLSARLRLLLFP